jgi:hypothetical protein
VSIPPQDPDHPDGPWQQPGAQQPGPQSSGQWGQPGPQQPDPQQPGPQQPQGGWNPPGPQGQAGYGPQGQTGYGPQSGPVPGAPAPGTDLGADLGASFTWMWRAFSRNLGAILVPGIVYGLVMLLFIGGAIVGGAAYMIHAMGPGMNPDALSFGQLIGFYGIVLLAAPFAVVITLLWQSGVAKAAGSIMTGRRPGIGESFVGSGRVMLTALVVSLLIGIGMALCYLPGLVLAVLLFFAIPAAAHGAGVVDAITQSFSLVTKNLPLVIVSYLILAVGSSILSSFLIGVVVTTPLMLLFQFALFERVNHRVAPEPVRA